MLTYINRHTFFFCYAHVLVIIDGRRVVVFIIFICVNIIIRGRYADGWIILVASN